MYRRRATAAIKDNIWRYEHGNEEPALDSQAAPEWRYQ